MEKIKGEAIPEFIAAVDEFKAAWKEEVLDVFIEPIVAKMEKCLTYRRERK